MSTERDVTERRSAPALRLGVSGHLSKAFIDSKLTPLVILLALGLGVFAILVTPREEEPQIKVPMIDVFVSRPGATPREIERQAIAPMERAFWSIPGIEYVYSTSSSGGGSLVLRFKVGEDPDRALVRVRAKLDSLADLLGSGLPPLLKPRSIDDVPIYALTFSSPNVPPQDLRGLAAEVQNEVQSIAEVSDTVLLGGLRRELRVELDPAALASRGLSLEQVLAAIVASNQRLKVGRLVAQGREFHVEAGDFVKTAADLGSVVIAASGGRPVHLRDVARVVDGPEEPRAYVSHAQGASPEPAPAVTLAISKRRGANAIDVVNAIERKVEALRPRLFSAGVRTAVTRNYGETAAEKSNELLKHMGLATLSVALLVALALGRREAGVVLLAVPVTLALTLATFALIGYTLNRITLFALIFSIGILVDDAIVVVENIVRHLRLPSSKGRPLAEVAIEATDEVGNPTILATLAVVAAIVPMGFVGGLMGPYMRPIPVGASAAMLFSLLIAFVVSPWASRRLLARSRDSHVATSATHADSESEGAVTRLYRRAMAPLVREDGRRPRLFFFVSVAVLLLTAIALVPLGIVTVKMLPFDNKNELQVVVDMPEGTPLESTHRVLSEMAAALSPLPEVRATTVYAGTAAPYNFNGLVRHYFLRSGSHQGDVQVTLSSRKERRRSSHEIAKAVRPLVTAIGRRFGARVKVAEVPPGPPVLQTLVAEIYGPTEEGRLRLGEEVKRVFERTESVVDVDWYVESPHEKVAFALDREKAGSLGIQQASLVAPLRLALSREGIDVLHLDDPREPVPLVLTLPAAFQNDPGRLATLTVPNSAGGLVPLSELGRFERRPEPRSIHHKNLKPVVYVTADVAGEKEAPVYAIGALTRAIEALPLPDGTRLRTQTAQAPFDTSRHGLKWDGEWHVTYEVFRDLGLAFAAVLGLIYVLVVGWFKSFKTPLVIMAPIPLTLVGILPAHGLFGVFFTATSMIGFIAGAGIIVRNSIILVDFIELRRAQGMALSEAVLDAGAVRFRPMLLTAAAVVAGSAVMVLDPIFQGLAVALISGAVVATVLTMVVVPLLYWEVRRV